MTNRKSLRYVIAVAAVVSPFSVARADVQLFRKKSLSQFRNGQPTISIVNFGSLISVASKDKDDYDQGYKNFGQWVSDQHRHHHPDHDGDDHDGGGGGGNCHHPGGPGGGGQGGAPPVVSPPVAGPPVVSPPVTSPPVAVTNPGSTTPPKH